MPVQSAPFPTVTDAVIAARVICNDMANSVLGNVLANNQPFVLPMADLAHKTLRKMLTKAGVESLNSYGYCLGMVPVATPDPTVQVQLSYTGYFDGVQMQATPFLPANLTEPLEVWVRQSGSYNRWSPVTQAADSISTRSQVALPGIWDWETDILYLPGFTQKNDLKLKYLIATPRLTAFNQQIPIADCEMAMGALIAELLSGGRGGAEAAAFHARAESEVDLLVVPSARKGQYAMSNRRPFRSSRARR